MTNLISSLEKSVFGSYGGVSSIKWLRPFSSTITDHPAAVSTSATVAPPGPEPTITASQSRSPTAALVPTRSVGSLRRYRWHIAHRTRGGGWDRGLLALGDLGVGVAAGLDVADPVDGLPAGEVPVAAVDGVAVHALARVLVEEPLEPGHAVEPGVLLVRPDGGEVGAERGQAVAVLLLKADDRAVPLSSRTAERPLDAGPPRQLVDAGQRRPPFEAGFPAVPSRERPARPDPWRIEAERPEQRVDIAGDARGRRARDETVDGRGDDREVGLAEERGHVRRWSAHRSRAGRAPAASPAAPPPP